MMTISRESPRKMPDTGRVMNGMKLPRLIISPLRRYFSQIGPRMKLHNDRRERQIKLGENEAHHRPTRSSVHTSKMRLLVPKEPTMQSTITIGSRMYFWNSSEAA